NGTAAVGFLKFDSNRSIVVDTLTDTTHAAWNAHSFNGAARATYTIPLGFAQLKPYISADYLGLWQDGYKEKPSATTTTGLAINAGSAESHLVTAAIGTSLAAEFGSDDTLRIRPELSVGYRDVIDWTDKSAQLTFAGGGSPFSLTNGHDPESAATAGIGLDINSEFLNIKLGYDAEFASKYTTHYGSITLRLAFW
ncbi:MAG: autotransporter outer membrane beta-barrel domain-containing protein, partial [Alphaproteobacteria bacterium]